jgi:hypothetical protein
MNLPPALYDPELGRFLEVDPWPANAPAPYAPVTTRL